MSVSQDTISKIKGLAVSDVLSRDGAALKKVGREFVTACLWHEDRNPSLTVSDDKGFVFCHVCQHHDDSIGYIQQKYGISFVQACEKIASSHGIAVVIDNEDPEQAAKEKQLRKSAYDKVSKQQIDFRANLKKYPESIAFIRERGIQPEISREFALGYDARSKRLTIPISNHLGNYVGFTARTILPDVKPKYKNTENNIIFNKSDIVFNEYRAAEHIRTNDECIFVEGHLDVVALWQAGIKNVVALQGTASPSERVLARLKRKTRRFVLCMDSDAGGMKAIAKFLQSIQSYLLSGEIEVRVAVLPDGMDPDDCIENGYDINELINNSQSWLDWTLDQWLAGVDFKNEIQLQDTERKIKDLFSQIESPALRTHYYDKASVRLAQNKQDLAAQIAKGFHEFSAAEVKLKTWKRPGIGFTRLLVEKRMLRLYIHRPDYRWILTPLMDRLHFPQMKWLWRRLVELESTVGPGFCAYSVMAILCIAEPVYMQKLRSITKPSFEITDDESAIAHMEEVMMMEIPAAMEC